MIERISCGSVNCYIIGRPGKCSLVDTATEEYFPQLYPRAAELGVRLIVLTHGHYDHVCGAAKLAAALGVPIAMHPADTPLLRQPDCSAMYADTFTGRVMLRAFRRGAARVVPPFEATVELCDKLDLSAFGAEGEIMTLPGHTPGSVGVFYDGALAAGDAVFNIFTACRAKIYCDRDAAEASYKRIMRDGRITGVYPGHGRPLFLKKNKPALMPLPD